MLNSILSFARAALMAAVAFTALPAAAQEPAATVRETHGAWEVRCTADDVCFMYQVANDAEGRPLLSMAVRPLATPRTSGDLTFVAVAEIQTRLGVYLPGGIAMQIDTTDTLRLPFERCTPQSCRAVPEVQAEFVERMKAGAEISFIVFANLNEPVQAIISLSGFTAAFDAL